MNSLSKILELTNAGFLCLDSYGQFILPGKQFQSISFTHCTQCVCVNGKPQNCLSVFCESSKNCEKTSILKKKGSCCKFICLKNKNNSYLNQIEFNRSQKIEKLLVPFHNLGIGVGIGNGNSNSAEIQKKSDEQKLKNKKTKSKYFSLSENLQQAGKNYAIYGAIVNSYGGLYNRTKNELNNFLTVNELFKNRSLNRNNVFYHNLTNQDYQIPNLNHINNGIWFAGQNSFRLFACACLLFFILAFALIFIQQIKQRRFFLMLPELQNRSNLDHTTNHRNLNSSFLSRTCHVEHPPPYRFCKTLSSNHQLNDSGEPPPPYEEATHNRPINYNLTLNNSDNDLFSYNNAMSLNTPIQKQLSYYQVSLQSMQLPSSSTLVSSKIQNKDLDINKVQHCIVDIPNNFQIKNNIEMISKSKNNKKKSSDSNLQSQSFLI